MSKLKRFLLMATASIFGAAALLSMIAGNDVGAIVGCILFCFCVTVSTEGDDKNVETKKLK